MKQSAPDPARATPDAHSMERTNHALPSRTLTLRGHDCARVRQRASMSRRRTHRRGPKPFGRRAKHVELCRETPTPPLRVRAQPHPWREISGAKKSQGMMAGDGSWRVLLLNLYILCLLHLTH